MTVKRIKGLDIEVFCTNAIEQYRLDTFWEKEPETLRWIESFEVGEYFFDIGANIGLYSLYACSMGSRVVAFEPMPYNFTRLLENMRLNDFMESMVCSNIGIADSEKADMVNLYDTLAGTSEVIKTSQADSLDFYTAFLPLGAMILNSFKETREYPYHIKIDVDGGELDIIKGLDFDDEQLKSLLIEWDKKKNDNSLLINFTTMMIEKGFTLENEFHKCKDHSRNRRDGNNPENLIFTRRNEQRA